MLLYFLSDTSLLFFFFFVCVLFICVVHDTCNACFTLFGVYGLSTTPENELAVPVTAHPSMPFHFPTFSLTKEL